MVKKRQNKKLIKYYIFFKLFIINKISSENWTNFFLLKQKNVVICKKMNYNKVK